MVDLESGGGVTATKSTALRVRKLHKTLFRARTAPGLMCTTPDADIVKCSGSISVRSTTTKSYGRKFRNCCARFIKSTFTSESSPVRPKNSTASSPVCGSPSSTGVVSAEAAITNSDTTAQPWTVGLRGYATVEMGRERSCSLTWNLDSRHSRHGLRFCCVHAHAGVASCAQGSVEVLVMLADLSPVVREERLLYAPADEC